MKRLNPKVSCDFCGKEGNAREANQGELLDREKMTHGALVVCPDCGAISTAELDGDELKMKLLTPDQIKSIPDRIRDQVLEVALPLTFKYIIAESEHPLAYAMRVSYCGRMDKLGGNNPKLS